MKIRGKEKQVDSHSYNFQSILFLLVTDSNSGNCNAFQFLIYSAVRTRTPTAQLLFQCMYVYMPSLFHSTLLDRMEPERKPVSALTHYFHCVQM